MEVNFLILITLFYSYYAIIVADLWGDFIKNVNFVLKSDDTIVSEITTSYKLINEMFCFDFDENTKIVLKGVEDYFYFKRETNDTLFEIIYENDNSIGLITLLHQNAKFEIPISDFTYQNNEGEIEVTYSVDGADEGIKTIIFKLIDKLNNP